jgi:broad specificity phosphatase PhoE
MAASIESTLAAVFQGLCNMATNDYAGGMRLILTRHYHTQSNFAGRILGWGDSPPRPGWETDVNYIVSRLRQAGVSVDAVYSSDLERARRTAMTYADAFAIPEVIAAPELKEINYGKLQTKVKAWVVRHYPQHKKDPDLVYPDGESFRHMQQRSVRFISYLAETHPRHTVLIVSHAGVIRGVISHFLGLEYAASLKQKIPFRYIGDFLLAGENCTLYDELGKRSGFVLAGGLEIPYSPGAHS